MPKLINSEIEDLEYTLAKLKFVQSNFPNTKYYNNPLKFCAKDINKLYTHFSFVNGRDSLYVEPFIELDFNYKDKLEKIKIHSSPIRSRLSYVTLNYNTRKRVINFSRVAINLKNSEFKEGLLNYCQTEMIKFIQKYPNAELNTKHLDNRLKKLITFT